MKTLITLFFGEEEPQTFKSKELIEFEEILNEKVLSTVLKSRILQNIETLLSIRKDCLSTYKLLKKVKLKKAKKERKKLYKKVKKITKKIEKLKLELVMINKIEDYENIEQLTLNLINQLKEL